MEQDQSSTSKRVRKATQILKTETTPSEGSSTNLKDYVALYKELNKNQMPERKKMALLNKLTTLFKEEIIDEKELKMFRFILTQDRARGTLGSAHNAILNEIEYNECTLECYVRSKEMPPVYGLAFDTKCRYKYDPDAGRQGVGHGKGRYFVYAPIVVPQDAQLSHKQALDKIEGREIDYSKVPPEKVFYKRIAFAKVEFDKWFGYDDEELIGNADTTETYEF